MSTCMHVCGRVLAVKFRVLCIVGKLNPSHLFWALNSQAHELLLMVPESTLHKSCVLWPDLHGSYSLRTLALFPCWLLQVLRWETGLQRMKWQLVALVPLYVVHSWHIVATLSMVSEMTSQLRHWVFASQRHSCSDCTCKIFRCWLWPKPRIPCPGRAPGQQGPVPSVASSFLPLCHARYHFCTH